MKRPGAALDELEAAVAKYMRNHHGLIRLDTALAMGFTYSMVQHRVEARLWRAVGRGVYCAAAAPTTEHQRLLAAAWGPAVHALASHRSAAWLWSVGDAPPVPEVTIGAAKISRISGVIVHRSLDLGALRPSRRAGIAVTDPFRTLIDLGAVASPSAVEDAVDRALASRLVTVPGILTAIEATSRQGVRGTGVLRNTLDRRGAQSRFYPPSVLESKMARLLKSLPLPTPSVELVAGGENQYRLDFSWPDVLVICRGRGLRAARRACDDGE